MDTANGNPAPPETPASGSFLRNPIVLGVAAIAILVAAYFLLVKTPPPSRSTAELHLPFGPAEEAYATKLQFGNFKMSRAENFLHQEVTTISGDVLNHGDRPLAALEITLTFQDDMSQIVLREARPALTPQDPQLVPGKTAHFDVSFDHIPDSWNVQVPLVRVTGLRFGDSR